LAVNCQMLDALLATDTGNIGRLYTCHFGLLIISNIELAYVLCFG
jgi:hypothetical protein